MIIQSDKEFYVSEIFESLQGEGNRVGMNSLFIRFHFCNLACPWCDTKYTWHKNDKAYEIYSKKDILNSISESKKSNIILTGGEPVLYKLDEFAANGISFHVETNGSIIPTQKLDTKLYHGISFKRSAMDENVIKDFNWIISPKLSNSRQELNEEALLFWASKEYATFKFIAQNVADIDEISNVSAQFGIEKSKIYIGIEGVTRESQLNQLLIDDILNQGYHYSPRLHILLWRNKKGK